MNGAARRHPGERRRTRRARSPWPRPRGAGSSRRRRGRRAAAQLAGEQDVGELALLVGAEGAIAPVLEVVEVEPGAEWASEETVTTRAGLAVAGRSGGARSGRKEVIGRERPLDPVDGRLAPPVDGAASLDEHVEGGIRAATSPASRRTSACDDRSATSRSPRPAGLAARTAASAASPRAGRAPQDRDGAEPARARATARPMAGGARIGTRVESLASNSRQR